MRNDFYSRKRLINKRKDFDGLFEVQLNMLRSITHSAYMLPHKHPFVKLDLNYPILARNTLDIYEKTLKKTALVGKESTKRSSLVYHALKNVIYQGGTSLVQKNVNEQAQYTELEDKTSKLDIILAYNRQNVKLLNGYSPFFACTIVKDCAEDHKDYQGRLYYDKDYPKYLKTSDLRHETTKYIREHHLMSIQAVTSQKPYLMTRPHCRHTFRIINIFDVLVNKNVDIEKKYNLVLKQIKPISYEERMFLYYSRKLKELSTIRKELRCKELDRDILSTASLVRKWKVIWERSQNNLR